MAVADVTGDKVPDIVAVPGLGGGPVVRVFDGTTGGLTASFYAFEATFRTGLARRRSAKLVWNPSRAPRLWRR